MEVVFSTDYELYKHDLQSNQLVKSKEVYGHKFFMAAN